MKAKLLVAAMAVFALFAAYRIGYESAQARFQVEAAQTARKVADAVSRATEALNHMSKRIEQGDLLDEQKIREIEDEAARDGATCRIPVDRLRGLDTIR